MYDFVEKIYESYQLPLYYISVKYFGAEESRLFPISGKYCKFTGEEYIQESEKKEIEKVTKLVKNLFFQDEKEIGVFFKEEADVFVIYYTFSYVSSNDFDLNKKPYIRVVWDKQRRKISSLVNYLYRDVEYNSKNIKVCKIDDYKQIILAIMEYYGFVCDDLKRLNMEKKISINCINMCGFMSITLVFTKDSFPDIDRICMIFSPSKKEIVGIFCHGRYDPWQDKFYIGEW